MISKGVHITSPFHRTRTLSYLVWDIRSNQIREAAASQDKIIWVEFLHGNVSVAIAYIQEIHCKLSNCRMTGEVGWSTSLASYCWYPTPSGCTTISPCTTKLGATCTCSASKKSWRKWIDSWIRVETKSRRKVSTYSSSTQSYWVLAIKAARREIKGHSTPKTTGYNTWPTSGVQL